jgi:hypothetical protein
MSDEASRSTETTRWKPRKPAFELKLLWLTLHEDWACENRRTHLTVSWYDPEDHGEDDVGGLFQFHLDTMAQAGELPQPSEEEDRWVASLDVPRKQAEALRDYLTFMLERVP